MSRRAASQPPVLPGYDYVKLLGSGGFSDVFLYDQRLPKRKVAVKVLLTDELNPQTRARFVAEANLMAQLSAHPYIVTIYHADVASDDRPYFVMEYCSGPSLADRYKRQPFGVEEALRTGIRVAGAVATAHSAGILHRDIKPANVLTNAFGWPALTDFGISSTLEDELPVQTTTASLRGGSGETSGNQSVGMSVPWSPAEMFEDDPQPDVRSDEFSLAATVYTLLAGRTPFEVVGKPNGTLDLIGRIERGMITPLNRDDVPRTLITVLRKAMSLRRSERFESVVDFARALQRVELELGYSPTSIEVPNLGVSMPDRESAPDGGDETRVRQVATVVAQPEKPPARQAPTEARRSAPNPPPAPVEATRLRGAAPVEGVQQDRTMLRPATVRQPEPAPRTAEPEPQPAGEPETSPRRRGLVLGIVAVSVVVVAAGIAAAIFIPRAQTPEPKTPGGGGAIDVSAVPDPEKGSVTRSADGTSITFTWKNPDPKKGDSYQWRQEGATTGPVPAPEATAEVTGVQPGSNVCIEVVIVRGGRTSANSLKECSS
jgi:serine/threonine protein kinase